MASLPRWARQYASSTYSDREYLITHAVALASALVAAVILAHSPRDWMVFAFFALAFGPGVFCNALFHIGATMWFRAYCPGAVTGFAGTNGAYFVYVGQTGHRRNPLARDPLQSALIQLLLTESDDRPEVIRSGLEA